MYRILTASKDTYITNKIINNSFRATDANVGQAGTLDLFKLFDESSISGSETPIELSRLLIQFDLNPLRALTSSVLNVNDSSFKCFLNLSDVYGGQTTPANFTINVFPLSKSFDEGFGRDVGIYQDLDSSNFITASSQNGISLWNLEGANNIGFLGSDSIDIIGSGVLTGITTSSLLSSQIFIDGDEDLNIDVTQIVSATLAGLIPDCGYRLSFTSVQENDNKTRFVKRFASRHSSNPRKKPKLRVSFDDTLFDDHSDFYFDLTGSLFLNNFHRGTPADIVSGSSLTSITGANCLLLTLTSGTYSASFTGSQHQIASNNVAGVYSATFAIPSNETLLKTEIINALSATFSEVWSSLDRTVTYLSSTLVIYPLHRTAFDNSQKRWHINITTAKATYKTFEKARFRVFAQLGNPEEDYKVKRIPFEIPSEILRNAYYRIRDFHTGDIIVPFDKTTNSTRLSIDCKGMFFDFFMDSLEIGRVYEIDLLVNENGVEEVYTGVSGKFKVEQY